MNKILVLLLLASPALSQRAMIDQNGTVVDVSRSTMDVTTGCTVVVLTSPDLPDETTSIQDEFGRYKFDVVNSRLRTLQTARWPAANAVAFPRWRTGSDDFGNALPLMTRKIDALLARASILQRWQGTPTLLSIRDRSAELQSVNNRIAALVAIYNEP